MDEGNRIRNKPAYLMGLLRRYSERGGGKGRGAVVRMDLDPVVRARLEQLFASGFCGPDDIDDRVMEMLRQLSSDEALEAIGEYCSITTDRIKNHSAYLTGILKRYLYKESPRGKGGGQWKFDGKGGGKGGGGEAYGRGGTPMGTITVPVNEALGALYDSGFCR